MELGGGEVSWAPSGVGKTTAFSNTIELEMTTIRSSRPWDTAWIAASKVEARIRSFSASRS